MFRTQKERTDNCVVISEITERVSKEALKAGVIATDTYVDYFLRCTTQSYWIRQSGGRIGQKI